MKKIFVFLFLCSMLLNSCGKTTSGCQPVPVISERAQLIAYCSANSINYTEHSSGLLYEIINPGTGVSPTATSSISVVYTGSHFNNTPFDFSNTPSVFMPLSNLVDGWKIGIPLIKKGGRIKLILPSALAYSCSGSKDTYGRVIIQPNEPIFFDITLTDVK